MCKCLYYCGIIAKLPLNNIIFRPHDPKIDNLKDIEKGVKEKFQWRWLTELDCNDDYFEAYVRKIDQPDPFLAFFPTMANLRKFNMICAADENLGIGKDGNLPWKLPREYAYFKRFAKWREDKSKKNAAIIGRKTFLLEDRHGVGHEDLCYIVISKTLKEVPPAASYLCRSVTEAIQVVSSEELKEQIENVWLWGGHGVYKEGMSLPQCHRIHLTRVFAKYECDAWFPGVNTNNYKLVSDPDVAEEIQEENGIKYKFEIYERKVENHNKTD